MEVMSARKQFERALNEVFTEKDGDKHSMAVGYATGVCETLYLSGLIDTVVYTKYMGELLATLQAQLVIEQVGHPTIKEIT